MDGIIIVRDNIVRFVNPRLAEMYRGSIEEILGTTLSEHVYPDDRPQAVDRYRRRLAGDSVSMTYETRLLRKDGTPVWCDVSGGMIIYEGRPADLLFVREVDERKKAEAALKESEEKYRVHLENISDVVYSLDRELHVLTISPSVEKILGYKPEEIIGKPLRELPFVTPESLRIAQDNIPRILAGETITATVYELRAKDGHKVIGEVSGTPLFRNGKIMGLVASARDITERRASETALAAGVRELEASKKNALQAQAVLRSILESPPDVVLFALDREFCYLAFNQNHKATMKTIWGADIEAGVSMLDYVGDLADRQKARRNFERALEGEAFVVDEEYGDVGLQRRYYEDRYSPIRAEDGAVIGLTVFLTDVTERRRVEEALQESRSRLDLALRSSNMGVWQWNIPENLRYFDEQTCRLLGIDPAGYHGQEEAFFNAIHPDDRAMVKEALTRSLEQGTPYEARYRVVWPDGSLHYITARGMPARDAAGHPLRISGVIWDVTERQRAEEALRESESQLSNAMTIARLGYWEYDVEKDEFLFNDHFYDIFRTSAEKVGGYRMSSRRYAELFVHPDDAFLVAEETGKALSAPDSFYSRQLEHRVIFAGGEIGFISVHVYVIKDKEGRTIRTYGANQDITGRKRAEMQVLASLKEKEVLLRELHHRVKNNMQIISSLLNLQAAHLKDPVVIQVFKDTQRRIRSMALVHEKLYQSENLSTIGFDNYLESLAVHLFHSYETEAAGIELVTEMDRILLDVQTAIPCGLLVNELLSNALKHAFPGGRKGRIEIGLHRLDDGRISLRIKDDGIGLPPALDVENTKTLGLQIVSSLISQLDGTLEISREGGTEFRILFKEAKYAQRP